MVFARASARKLGVWPKTSGWPMRRFRERHCPHPLPWRWLACLAGDRETIGFGHLANAEQRRLAVHLYGLTVLAGLCIWSVRRT